MATEASGTKVVRLGPHSLLAPRQVRPRARLPRLQREHHWGHCWAVWREKRTQLYGRRKDLRAVAKVQSQRTWRTQNPRKNRSFTLGGSGGWGAVRRGGGGQWNTRTGHIAKKRWRGWWCIVSRLLPPHSTSEGRLAPWDHHNQSRSMTRNTAQMWTAQGAPRRLKGKPGPHKNQKGEKKRTQHKR